MNRGSWQGLLLAFATCYMGAGVAWSAENNAVERAVGALFQDTKGRVNWQERIDRVAALGKEAVPVLIARFPEAAPERSWLATRALCLIPSSDSLNFLVGLLENHDDKGAVREIIRSFPINQEDRIIDGLIGLLGVPGLSVSAESRLREMIARKPTRAGKLVAALDPLEESMVGNNWVIGEVLAAVSGYRHTWCCDGRPDVNWGQWQRAFWIEWWQRNEDKSQLDWIVETYRGGSQNPTRQAQAVQVLAHLRDPKSLPLLLEALDSSDEGTRYWAVVALLRLENPEDNSGYVWEAFQKEQALIIDRLKFKYSKKARNMHSP